MQRYASLRQGLVGCWCPSVSGPFGYRLPDISGYGNHGTLTNMDPGSDWVVSGGKGALDFDGSNDHANIGNASCLQFDFNTPVSMCSWIRTTGSSGGIIGKRTSNGWYFSLEAANVVGFILQGTSITAVIVKSVASGVSDGNWHHICATYKGNNLNASGVSIFVDGKSVSTTVALNNGTGTAITTLPVVIGSIATNEFYFTGQLDDIRIYNRALSEQEIRLLASERGIGLKPERQRNRYLVPALPSRNRSSRFLGFPS